MVDKFAEIPMFLGKNIIQGIFISIALIILVRHLFKEKIETNISLEIIRWLIIIYNIIALTSWMLVLLFPHSEKYAFLERATGPYAWAYWMMLIMNYVLPLILFHKKLGKKIYFIFLIALLMNAGWLFERFVIFTTSLHRDYADNGFNESLKLSRETKILIRGFIIGLISLAIGNTINTANKRLFN